MQEVTDDYELVRPLGTGGFAKVFVGKNIHTEQDVAIKRIEMLKCGNIVLLDVEWYSCSAPVSYTHLTLPTTPYV